jgi:type VI secretion system protein ImpA
MAALAAQETSGRARFLRKLMLSDVCLGIGRDRLARIVLEELNRQIEEYKLERWESSGLVGAVWSRLYRLYRKSESSSDQDLAAQLYNQLCRLDPWQAFVSCED